LEGIIANGLRKEAALTREPMTSAKERGERDNAGVRSVTGLRPARPKAGREWAARAVHGAGGQVDNREEVGKEMEGSWANGLKAKNEMENVFSFFLVIPKEFQIDFEFLF
jgi:hypothetical protein